MKVKCSMCGCLLKELGGLLFSPPLCDLKLPIGSNVNKYHICVSCFDTLIDIVDKYDPNVIESDTEA